MNPGVAPLHLRLTTAIGGFGGGIWQGPRATASGVSSSAVRFVWKGPVRHVLPHDVPSPVTKQQPPEPIERQAVTGRVQHNRLESQPRHMFMAGSDVLLDERGRVGVPQGPRSRPTYPAATGQQSDQSDDGSAGDVRSLAVASRTVLAEAEHVHSPGGWLPSLVPSPDNLYTRRFGEKRGKPQYQN